jgi:3'(2'), 5'-bisphosphate nucleotidase
LLPLTSLARRAGAAILDIYGSAFTVTAKSDASPVTQADLRAERIILTELEHLTPGVPVVSEEAVAAGCRVDISGGTFWLVDPLDGTKEFVKRNGEFTVNMGLVIDGVPSVGVIYAPAADRLFAAAPGYATVEEGDRRPRPIATRPPPSTGLVVLSSRSHRNPDAFAEFIRPYAVAEVRHSGSALKFALIAAGEADLYPRFGRTMEWDIAAGHALLTAAGGCLSLPDGGDLAYGKPGFENPPLVAWATARPDLRRPP